MLAAAIWHSPQRRRLVRGPGRLLNRRDVNPSQTGGLLSKSLKRAQEIKGLILRHSGAFFQQAASVFVVVDAENAGVPYG